ncbi:MAG: hypothetical protein NXI10_11065 [bacterium]|nr:hypothetical protein [bacterium]
MRKLVLVIAFFVCSLTASYGQVWGAQGATWHYEFDDFGKGFYTYTYSGDTVIDGYSCQKIDVELQWIIAGSNGTTSPGSLDQYVQITRYSNDSVFWYKDDAFFLLYDFGASIGDQWVIHEGPSFFDPECDTVSIVSVSDTGMMTINGQSLRFIELNYVQGQYSISGRAIERMGVANDNWYPQNLLFPSQVTCDTNIITEYFFNHFRCYTDNALGTYSVVSEACDLPLTTLSLSEIKFESEKQVERVYDLLGREVEHPKHQMVILLYSDGSLEKRYID